MSFIRALLVTTITSFTILASGLIQAAQFLETTDYQIHYNAFNTMMVTPKTAQALGFTRARNRALLNLSLIHI